MKIKMKMKNKTSNKKNSLVQNKMTKMMNELKIGFFLSFYFYFKRFHFLIIESNFINFAGI